MQNRLILLRHGESLFNKKNVFAGWVDIALSEKGIEEAYEAGEKIADINFDLIYTSTLFRSLQTALICMLKNRHDRVPIIMNREDERSKRWSIIYNKELNETTIPVYQDWHLNERYYGELQGKNKAETAKIYGEEQVKIWRRSYNTPPPKGESLRDTLRRTLPFFESVIIPLFCGSRKNILIAAHGNSLRSIVMHLDNLDEKKVVELEIATGDPVIYVYNGDKINKES